MNKPVSLICNVVLTCSLFGPVTTADENRAVQDAKDKMPSSVSVLCYGQLRHGLSAIGGETTGTTIQFHKVTWELQVPDEASRQFAEQQHKQPVVVTGTLRKVAGIEVPDRWIVDVNRIARPDAGEVGEEGAKLTIQGTLRAALSKTGTVPNLSVSTGNQRWQLDVTTDRRIQSTAESLILQPVLVSGSLLLPTPTDSRTPTNPPPASTNYSVRVRTIQPVSGAAPP
jgi:hypothetical protein